MASNDEDLVKYLRSVGETVEWLHEENPFMKAACSDNEKILGLMNIYIAKRDCNNWRRAHGLPLRRKGLSKRKQRKSAYYMLDEFWRINEFTPPENREFNRKFYSSLKRAARGYRPTDILPGPVAESEALTVTVMH